MKSLDVNQDRIIVDLPPQKINICFFHMFFMNEKASPASRKLNVCVYLRVSAAKFIYYHVNPVYPV